jgi:hypothetical protein
MVRAAIFILDTLGGQIPTAIDCCRLRGARQREEISSTTILSTAGVTRVNARRVARFSGMLQP